MVTCTINIPPMLAYIPYMDPMGLINFGIHSTRHDWNVSTRAQMFIGQELCRSCGYIWDPCNTTKPCQRLRLLRTARDWNKERRSYLDVQAITHTYIYVIIILYYIILYYNILYYIILYYYYIILYYIMLYYIILCYVILYIIMLYCIILYYIIIYYIILYYIKLYDNYIILYYIILYCIILYFTILYEIIILCYVMFYYILL